MYVFVSGKRMNGSLSNEEMGLETGRNCWEIEGERERGEAVKGTGQRGSNAIPSPRQRRKNGWKGGKGEMGGGWGIDSLPQSPSLSSIHAMLCWSVKGRLKNPLPSCPFTLYSLLASLRTNFSRYSLINSAAHEIFLEFLQLSSRLLPSFDQQKKSHSLNTILEMGRTGLYRFLSLGEFKNWDFNGFFFLFKFSIIM